VNLEQPSYSIIEGETVTVCLKVKGSVLGLPLVAVPVWTDQTAIGKSPTCTYMYIILMIVRLY